MCEQTTVEYKHGDVVWVKLRSCWWPGEVISFENLPGDVQESFKKPPLAAVKFFDEENFEFIKDLSRIYTYNCNKKYDFIKKGLDLHRSKHAFMEKFPTDIGIAETKTGGDPNILNDIKFTPQKKTSYSNIFGTPTPKKAGKESPKSKAKTNQSTSQKKVSTLITHPRFIGKDDHVVRELIQSPAKPMQPQTEYQCQNCDFSSSRIDVIVLHNKSHIQGVYTTGTTRKTKRPPAKKTTKKTPRMSRSKTSTIDEDIALILKGVPICSEEDSDNSDLSPVKPKKKKTTKKIPKPAISPVPEPAPKDIRKDLLAEWDDDDDEEEVQTESDQIMEELTIKKKEQTVEVLKLYAKTNSCFDFSEEDDDVGKRVEGRKIPRVLPEKDICKDELTCGSEYSEKNFENKSVVKELEDKTSEKMVEIKSSEKESDNDFEEKELEVEFEAQESQKAMKIKKSKIEPEKEVEIKTSEKEIEQKSEKELEDETQQKDLERKSDKEFEDKKSKYKSALSEKVQQKGRETENKEEVPIEDNLDAFNIMLEETEVPKLPDIPQLQKDEQNFHNAKTIKFPDKVTSPDPSNEFLPKVADSTEKEIPKPSVATKLTNPKKRFVKTFEDETKNSTKEKDFPKDTSKDVERKIEKDDKLKKKEELKHEKIDIVRKEKQEQEKICKKSKDQKDKKENKEEETPKVNKEEKTTKENKVEKESKREKEIPFDVNLKVSKLKSQLNLKLMNLDDVENKDKRSRVLKKRLSSEMANSESGSDFDDPKEKAIETRGRKKRKFSEGKEEYARKKVGKVSKQSYREKKIAVPNEMLEEIDNSPNSATTNLQLSETEKMAIHDIIGVSPRSVPSTSRTTNEEREDTFELKSKNIKKFFLENVESIRESNKTIIPESDIVDIEGNLTIVSEKELADKQVEISAIPEVHKPITLTSFSMDFCEEFPSDTILSPKLTEKEKREEVPMEIDFEDTKTIEEERVDICESESYIEKIESEDDGLREDDQKLEVQMNQKLKSDMKLEGAEKIIDGSLPEVDQAPEVLQLLDVDQQQEIVHVQEVGHVVDDINSKKDQSRGGQMLDHHKLEGEQKLEDYKELENEQNIQDEQKLEDEHKLEDEQQLEVNPEPNDEQKIDNEQKLENGNKVDDEQKLEIDQKVEDEQKLEQEQKLEDEQKLAENDQTLEDAPKEKNEEEPKTFPNQPDQESDSDQNLNDGKKVDTEKSHFDQNPENSDEKDLCKEMEANSVVVEDVGTREIRRRLSNKPEITLERITKRTTTPKLDELIEHELLTTDEDVECKKSMEFDFEDLLNEKVTTSELTSPKKDIESQVAEITNTIGDQEVIIESNNQTTTSTRLLEILTDQPKSRVGKLVSKMVESLPQSDSKKSKFVVKAATPGSSKSKSIILSEKIIEPVAEIESVHVKKVTTKRSFQDIEDIDTYIIQKPAKKIAIESEVSTTPQQKFQTQNKQIKPIAKGKARILQQTIITPSGDIIQPAVTQSADDLYDINSMPIVLGDQILTPESLEKAPVVLQQHASVKQINPIKKPVTTSSQMTVLNKPLAQTITKESGKVVPTQSKSYFGHRQKAQKVYQTSSTRLLKNNPSIMSQPGKPGKFIIVPSTTPPTGTKYTVGKRPAIKKQPLPQLQKVPVSATSTKAITSEPSGNKIMILTNSQGQQQKLLLTPAQHKQLLGPKKKTIIQKQIISKETPQRGANIISQTIVTPKGQVTTINSSTISTGPVLQQSRNFKLDQKLKRPLQQKLFGESPLLKPGTSGQQRTIIIKNPQGQTVKKIQGTDDALLEQQVAEQLHAINRAAVKNQMKEALKPQVRTPIKKTPILRKEPKPIPVQRPIQNATVPPLAPISPQKPEATTSLAETKIDEKTDEKPTFVIRDGNGALINITEGQILALPSEAVDGQPQSYVLVTIDESGNLTPLSSEALMSLDPNLNIGGDLNSTVLQIEQGVQQEGDAQVQATQDTPQVETTEVISEPPKEILEKPTENIVSEPLAIPSTSNEIPPPEQQTVQAFVNAGEMGQLIITGDAVSAQKFLDSLAEGNTDLANILANTDGNVLIQTDGDQILINTNADNSMVLMNQDVGEGNGNPVFAGHAVNKNQDILAAALADTDVFQQEQLMINPPSKVVQSQLSPNSGLFPINVGNVLETNTMSSPIMTPLEVPSTNTKKIGDEHDILNQDPKNIVLPITITDPSISQTAAHHQQVASLIGSDLQANLDLPLAIQDPGLMVTSSGINSPSFVYSLPTLDDTDINQKSFGSSMSMPLLTEEPEEVQCTTAEIPTDSKDIEQILDEEKDTIAQSELPKETESETKTDEYSMRTEDICNSLSEPPPDIFDFTIDSERPTPEIDSTPSSVMSNCADQDNMEIDRPIQQSDSSLEGSVKLDDKNSEDATFFNTTSPTSTDDSCEIPLQPPIITNLDEKSFDENGTSEDKSFSTDGDM